MKKIRQIFTTAFILSIALFCVGVAVWFFWNTSGTSLPDMLFYVGAVPIVIFSLAQMGDFFGKGDQSYQLSRSVSGGSAHQRAAQDAGGIKSRLKSGLTWIIAGLLVWLYGYLLGFII